MFRKWVFENEIELKVKTTTPYNAWLNRDGSKLRSVLSRSYIQVTQVPFAILTSSAKELFAFTLPFEFTFLSGLSCP